MPSWKKLIISGSDAAIPSVSNTGDFTIDAGGDIILDADGADIVLKDGGTHFGSIKRVTSDLVIKSETSNKHMLFKGNDGGATITALDLDMENAGNASFNNDVDVSGALTLGTALAVAEGGTGATSLTSNSLLTGNGTSAIQAESNVTYDGSTFQIAGNNTRAGLTLKTGDNTNDRGIGFMNSGGSYNALIYVSDAGSNQGNIVFSTGTVSGTLSAHSPSMTLDDSANLNVVGDVVAFYSSDKRLKDNIIRIENPLEKIKKIGGYEFDWNDKQKTYEGHDIGVIAQEIQEVLPEVVTERDTGYLAVKYEKLVPLLIESIKEQQKQIDEIKQKCDCLNK